METFQDKLGSSMQNRTSKIYNQYDSNPKPPEIIDGDMCSLCGAVGQKCSETMTKERETIQARNDKKEETYN